MANTKEQGDVAMTEREELEQNIIRILYSICQEVEPEDIVKEFELRLPIMFEPYEIQKRTTDIVPYSEEINEKVLKQFVIAKTIAGRSEGTIRYYVETINKFTGVIQKDFDKITTEDARYYFAIQKMSKKISDVSMDNERRILHTFFKWADMSGYIQKNPIETLDVIKCAKKKKKAFTEMELEKIRAACKTERDKMMVEFLLSTGCRISEMCEVKIVDIENESIVVHGKGNKYRTVYLNAKAMFAINNYLTKREDDDPYLLHGRAGHLTSSSVESIVKEIGRRAGVDKCHPHRFRRTCATMALRRGMPVEQVSKMLGHEKLNTTQIYLDLEETELEYNHKKYVN